MMNLILNQFKNAEKPYNTKELSDLIGVPHSVTRTILEMLQSADLIIPTQQRYESAPRYVPAMSVDHLTKENILKSLENSGLGADQKDYGDLIEKME